MPIAAVVANAPIVPAAEQGWTGPRGKKRFPRYLVWIHMN
jgi:hypothetical protein